MKKKLFLSIAFLLTPLLASCGCSANSSNSDSDKEVESKVVEDVEADETMFGNADKKTVTEFDAVITLSGSEASFSGDTSGLSFSSGVVTITQSGAYKVSGTSDGISIVVNDTSKKDNIFLVLEGVVMTHSSKACIVVSSADKVIIQAKEGSLNSLSSTFSSSYTLNSQTIDATIHSKDTLTFSGTGTLSVLGKLKAVESKDDVRVYGSGSFTFSSSNDKALNINDSFRMGGSANVIVSSKEDGIHVENSTGDSFFYMENGSLNIESLLDGVDVSTSASSFTGYIKLVSGVINVKTTSSISSESRKGIKCAGDIYTGDVAISINAKDDALHSNGSISITNGSYCLSSGDDGIHADNTFALKKGDITIEKASEGIESNHIQVSGGSLTIYSTDDGINASKKINETPTILIEGGLIDITVGSGDVDGIDSNGSYTQTGGTVITRSAPNTTGGTATGIDTDGGITIKGGNFICVGAHEGTIGKADGVYGFDLGSTSGGPGGGGGGPRSNNPNYASSISLTAGNWTISDIDVTFTLAGNFYGISVYSSNFSKGSTYTISNGSSSYTGTAA